MINSKAIVFCFFAVFVGLCYQCCMLLSDESDSSLRTATTHTNNVVDSTHNRIVYVSYALTDGQKHTVPYGPHVWAKLEQIRNELVMLEIPFGIEETNISPQQFGAVLSAPHLKMVSVRDAHFLNETHYKECMPSSTLEYFRIEGGKSTPEFLSKLLSNCPKLTTLSFQVAATHQPGQKDLASHMNSLSIPLHLRGGVLRLGDPALFHNSFSSFKPSENLKYLDIINPIPIKPLDCTGIDKFPNLLGLILDGVSLESEPVKQALYHLKDFSVTRGQVSMNETLDMERVHLKYLGFKYCDITPALLSQLLRNSTLQILNLRGSNITDSLHVLEDATDSPLEGIILGKTQIKDEDIRYLKNLKKLILLDISNTSLTDGCIDYLLQNEQLRFIACKNVKFSDTGLKRLLSAGKIVLGREQEIGTMIAKGLVTVSGKDQTDVLPFKLSSELFDALDDMTSIFPDLPSDKNE